MPMLVCFVAIIVMVYAFLRSPVRRDPIAIGAVVVGCALVVLIGLNWDIVGHATVHIFQGSPHVPVGNR